MIANIVFFVLLSSGSAYMAVKGKGKYEDVLPVTTVGIVFILFLFGLIGSLKYGFIILVFILGILWIITCGDLINALVKNKRESINKFVNYFFTSGFWQFSCLYLFFNYMVYGMRLHEWDERAQWAPTVKAMTIYDVFITETPVRTSMTSYPPATALFHYFFQKVYGLFTQEGAFSEWRLYLSILVLAFVFIIPIISRIEINNWKNSLLMLLTYVLLPVVFYSNFYHSLYIDGLEGILSGCGMAMLLFYKKDDKRIYEPYLISVLFMLSMIRIDGLLLAGIIGIGYLILAWNAETRKKPMIIWSILGAIMTLVPFSIWTYHFKMSGKPSGNSNPIEIKKFLEVLAGKDDGYRATTWKLFQTTLFKNSEAGKTNFAIGDTNITISYYTVLVLLFLLLIICTFLMERKNEKIAKRMKIINWLLFVRWIGYYLMVLLIFLFQFSEQQALSLSSYVRYTHIIYLSMAIVVLEYLHIVIKEYISIKSQYIFNIIIVCFVSIFVSMYDVYISFSRRAVAESYTYYNEYSDIVNKINKAVNSEKEVRIWYIAQDPVGWRSGSGALQVYVECMPAIIGFNYDPWVLTDEPEQVGWFSAKYTAEEWKTKLMKEYDYVAIHQVDDYFINTYSKLFEDPDSIINDGLYRVNKSTGMLQLWEGGF